VAGGVALWEVRLEDRWATKRWGEVAPGVVFRCGRLPRERMTAVLRAHGIRVLVDLTEPGAHTERQAREQAEATSLGIAYHNLPLRGDGTGAIERYEEAVSLIAQARREGWPILVHCAAGAQRTGGVVAAYRLLVEGWEPDAVRREMRRYGWRPGRDGALLEFLNRHMARLAARLVEQGVIPAVPDPLPRL